jgi:rhamnosyl/mannosyltransferase
VWRERSWLAPASCDFGSVAAFRLFAWRAAAADVLHFHFPWPFADLLNMLGVARRPKVMTYHSDIVRQRALSMLYGPLMRRTLMSMDAVVATSPTYIKTSPVLQSIAATGKVKVIPFGIRDYLPEYSTRQLFARTKSSILDRLNLLQGKFVLALGVLRYYKGLHTLIEAANQVGRTMLFLPARSRKMKSVTCSPDVRFSRFLPTCVPKPSVWCWSRLQCSGSPWSPARSAREHRL